MTDDKRVSNHGHHSFFQCSQCHRGFSRQDHLSRHFRTHTLERPFQCTICIKTFARADLLKRHLAQHSASSSHRRGINQTSEPGRRVFQACKTCASSKLKCSDEKPCTRCVRKNILCDYEQASAETQAFESNNSNNDNGSNSNDGEDDDDITTTGNNSRYQDQPLLMPGAQFLSSPPSDQAQTQPPLIRPNASYVVDGTTIAQGSSTSILPNVQMMAAMTSNRQDDTCMLSSDSTELPTSQFDNYDNGTLSYSVVLKDILGSSAVSPMALGIGVAGEVASNFWDQYLGTEQTFNGFDDVSSLHASAVNELIPGSSLPEIDVRNSSSFEEAAFAAGSKAFQVSGWNWGPTSQDSVSAEHPKLILPPGLVRLENVKGQPQNLASPLLTQRDRHRILSLLVQHCDKENWVSIASSFPSELLLENMLQRFFASQAVDTLSWFHVPSFRCDSIRDELLAAVVANGACLTPIESVQKFGYVMPELLRFAVIDTWTRDNSTSRDLQLLQTCVIVATLSIWSGDKRKMEIGESTVQPLITIIRRARWLHTDHYRSIIPDSDDEGPDLHRKWQLWVEQESKKRLIYRTFVFDAQMSMMNHVNPLMSYSEMRVPFPENDEMWWALSAEDWKAAYFHCSHLILRPSLTLADAVRVILSEGDRPEAGFTSATTLYVLYGLWGLVWEIQQLQETLNLGGLHETPSWMLTSRREMLMKALNSIRIQKSSSPENHSSVGFEEPLLVLEYLCMALHVALQGLQSFTGRDGQREARRIYPVLQEWTQSREAREAIWHAGQVYRAARDHPTSRMRDLRVTLVYQASVTFWVYGIITHAYRNPARRDEQPLLPSQWKGALDKLVWLDGENSSAVRKFIAISEGVPALRDSILGITSYPSPGENAACRLDNASATMGLAIDILRRPLAKGEGAQLPLVNSITGLMVEIGKVAKMLQSK